MKALASSLLFVSAAAVLATSSSAQENPCSELIYPTVQSMTPGPSGPQPFFTVISVTNTNTQPATPSDFGGSTNVHFNYFNTVHNPADSQLPLDCYVVDRVEHLTPGDTLSVLTSCHNAANARGWAQVVAQDPSQFKTNWNFPHLIGHELLVNAQGGTYSVNAIPGDNAQSDGLYMEFVAVAGSSLSIGHYQDPTNPQSYVPTQVVLAFDIFNDNEFQLSSTKIFRCWFDEPLTNVSPVFREEFLRNNTPHDPQELDVNCDGTGDLETGWAIIRSVLGNTDTEVLKSPPIFGVVTSGPTSLIDGGHHLWRARPD